MSLISAGSISLASTVPLIYSIPENNYQQKIFAALRSIAACCLQMCANMADPTQLRGVGGG